MHAGESQLGRVRQATLIVGSSSDLQECHDGRLVHSTRSSSVHIMASPPVKFDVLDHRGLRRELENETKTVSASITHAGDRF